MKNKLIIVGIIALMLVALSSFALAEDGNEVKVFGLELEKLLNIGSGLLAAALSALTFISYHRSKNKRLLYVGVAFMLFAVKSFLIGAEIFFGEWLWVDPVASISDFAILLSFFLGIIKK
jgi:Co/Zn/Cd efflux system component